MEIFCDVAGFPWPIIFGDPDRADVTAAILREARKRPEKFIQRLHDPFRCSEILSVLCGLPLGSLVGQPEVQAQATQALLAEMASYAPDDPDIALCIGLALQPQEPGAWARSATSSPAASPSAGTVCAATLGGIYCAAKPITLQGAESGSKRPTFDILGYTGAPMNLEGFGLPVVLDIAGIDVSRQAIPVLRQHDINRIVGQTHTILKSTGGVRLAGAVTANSDAAREVVEHASNGFNWQASIGATVDSREMLADGRKATVNNREVEGPVILVHKSTLKEISFVPIGADTATSASVAAMG